MTYPLGTTYTSFDKVKSIAQGGDSLIFIYGASYDRKRVDFYKNGILYLVVNRIEITKELILQNFLKKKSVSKFSILSFFS
jgi:hypothetical protein